VPLVALTPLAACGCCWFLVKILTASTFGLRNEDHFLAPRFLFWFVEQNKLIYHHFISYMLVFSNNMRNEFIPLNL
jgi:hypothetical protein